MRGFLYVAFGIGCLLALGGVIERLGLQNAMTTQPAIVVMPQVIGAWLVAGFGLVTTAVSAAGLAICNVLEGLKLNPQITVNAPAAAPAAGSPLSPRAGSDLPDLRTDEQKAKVCARCHTKGRMFTGRCAACGFDEITGKGAHGG